MKKAPKGIKRKKYVDGTNEDGVQQLDENGQPITSANTLPLTSGTQFKTTGNITPTMQQGTTSNVPNVQGVKTPKGNLGSKISGSMGWMQYAKTASDAVRLGNDAKNLQTETDPLTGKTYKKYNGIGALATESWAQPTHEKVLNDVKTGDYKGAAGQFFGGHLYDAFEKQKQQKEFDKQKPIIDAENRKLATPDLTVAEMIARRNRGETNINQTTSAINPTINPTINGMAKGGEVKGKGTGTSDSNNAEMQKGSFIVPAKNAEMAERVRKSVLGKKTGKADLHKGSVPIKISAGEHVFTAEEKDKIEEELGEDFLKSLAPEAEEGDEKKDGGELTSEKAKLILKDGTIRGHKISDKQAKYFGWIAGGRKMATGGAVEDFGVTDESNDGLATGGEVDDKKIGDTIIKNEYSSPATFTKLPLLNKEIDDAEYNKYKSSLKKDYEAISKSGLSPEEYYKKYPNQIEYNRKTFDQNNFRKKVEFNTGGEVKGYEKGGTVPESEKQKAIERYKRNNPSQKGTKEWDAKIKEISDDTNYIYNKDAGEYEFNPDEGHKQRMANLNTKIAGYKKALENVKSKPKTTPVATSRVLDKQPTTTPPAKTQVAGNKTNAYANWRDSLRPNKAGFEDTGNYPTVPTGLPATETIDATKEITNPTKNAIDTNPVTTTKPSLWDKVNKTDFSGALTGAMNYGLSAYQIGKGLQGLKNSGARPIYKIDPTFNADVNTAHANAQFGFTPQQQFMLDQQNQQALNAGRFAARNYSGGSGGNAFNMERNAINDSFTRSLENASNNMQLQQSKQQYATGLAAQRAGMSRQIFEDSLNAFNQKQMANADLLNAGIGNAMDANRFSNYMRLRGQENNFNSQYNP